MDQDLHDSRPDYYVVTQRGKDWEVWMWTGHRWYEPGEADAKDAPYWCQRVPQAPHPDDT